MTFSGDLGQTPARLIAVPGRRLRRDGTKLLSHTIGPLDNMARVRVADTRRELAAPSADRVAGARRHLDRDRRRRRRAQSHRCRGAAPHRRSVHTSQGLAALQIRITTPTGGSVVTGRPMSVPTRMTRFFSEGIGARARRDGGDLFPAATAPPEVRAATTDDPARRRPAPGGRSRQTNGDGVGERFRRWRR